MYINVYLHNNIYNRTALTFIVNDALTRFYRVPVREIARRDRVFTVHPRAHATARRIRQFACRALNKFSV